MVVLLIPSLKVGVGGYHKIQRVNNYSLVQEQLQSNTSMKYKMEQNREEKEWIPPQSDCLLRCASVSHVFVTLQSQEMLSNLESTSTRIVKLPQPPYSSGARTVHSSLPFHQAQQLSQAAAPPAASNSTPAPGPSYVPTPDSAGGLRMATIQEDTSSDSHLGEEGQPDDFTTAGASSSATKSSYEDLTEQNQSTRDRRRLKRQECIDSKETEC